MGLREACRPKIVIEWQEKDTKEGEGTTPGEGETLRQMITH